MVPVRPSAPSMLFLTVNTCSIQPVVAIVDARRWLGRLAHSAVVPLGQMAPGWVSARFR
jgi:hypothetical protein